MFVLAFFFPQVSWGQDAVKASTSLKNTKIVVHFDARGLRDIYDQAQHRTFRFAADGFSIQLGDETIRSEDLPNPRVEKTPASIRYVFDQGSYHIEVVYEVRPGWRFVAKQVFVVPEGAPRSFHVAKIVPVRAKLSEDPKASYTPQNRSWQKRTAGKDFGIFLRFEDQNGLFALVQNPFLDVRQVAGAFDLSYQADMDWNSAEGAFKSDRACIGTYALSNQMVPVDMIPEWSLANTSPSAELPEEDQSEIEAYEDSVRAFVLPHPQRTVKMEVGWTLNDYQIDVATAEGRAEYKRVIDRAAALGADHLLFAPSNSKLALRNDDADDWHWEHVLWLGLGQEIRRGEWDPASGPIPASVREMLDYAQAKRVKLVAYVYPVLPFVQNPAWLVGEKKNAANLGVRSFQDWLIRRLTAFCRRTGIGGYAFDYTFLDLPGTSEYAQWWGWRRVLESLRKQIPDIVIDGRQSYQTYGPWIWLAGSYPHPTSTDEQPESFVPFPDLHFDRVSADRERYTAYRYRIRDFCPPELMPGYITHQTPRLDDNGNEIETPFRRRDWDYLGWRYSLISSIAVAGLNNVLDMIPARDIAEYKSFSPADVAFFRKWIAWTDQNRPYLLRTRFILGQPAVGQVDGTSALLDGQGYVFLFNPNGRKLAASFKLDPSIGLSGSGSLVIEELYPQSGRRIGKPGAGFWRYGDAVSIPMEGASAIVLRIRPGTSAITAPVLFNSPGKARMIAGNLSLSGVSGPAGTSSDLLARLPPHEQAKQVTVNGRRVQFTQEQDVVTIPLRFEGEEFAAMQQVGSYDPQFTGGVLNAKFRIPKKVFDQLKARQKAWPIPWTAEDLKTPWLGPARLLLFVQIAEPKDDMAVNLILDGKTTPLTKAYSSVRPNARSFVGFYADISTLEPDRHHEVRLDLPSLQPGQFQGLFFENIETEYTARIAQ